MSGDTTYQALKRLSWLPERTEEFNGNVIAGQEYDDVSFIGGNASNLVLTDCTINGLVYAPTVRYITTAGGVTVLNTDNVIVLNKTVGATTTVTLPAVPAAKQYVSIKDGNGDANSNNITVSGNGNTMDGGATYVIGNSYGWLNLIWNSVAWSIIG